MKLTSKLLVILAAAVASVLADTTETVPKNEEVNQNQAFEPFPVVLDEACTNYIAINSDCPPHGVYADVKVYEEDCVLFESEKCQKLYKTSLADVPECKNVDKIYLLGYDRMIKMSYVSAKLNCGKDEKGNNCPLSPIGLQKKYNFNVVTNEELPEVQKTEIYNKAIKETCNSNKCSADFLEVIETAKDDYKQYLEEVSKSQSLTEADKKDFIRLYNYMMSITLNETFKYQPIDSFETQCDVKNIKVNAESGANSLTYSSALFITLALLLLSLI